MIVLNATMLEEQLLGLSRQQLEAEAVANDTEQLVTQAEEAIGEVRNAFDHLCKGNPNVCPPVGVCAKGCNRAGEHCPLFGRFSLILWYQYFKLRR